MKRLTGAGRAILLLATLTTWAVVHASPAGGQVPLAPVVSRPRAEATREEQAPKVDGRLDESLWHRAHFIRDFTQRDPHEGQKATQETEVAFVYTEDALYVGARMRSDSTSW